LIRRNSFIGVKILTPIIDLPDFLPDRPSY